MLSLDETDAVSADALRDAMDPLWYSLGSQERQLLDERSLGVITSLEGLRVPIGHHLAYALERPSPRRPLPQVPIRDWAA